MATVKIEHLETRVILTLTEDEALSLKGILGNIGCMRNSDVGRHADNIWQSLSQGLESHSTCPPYTINSPFTDNVIFNKKSLKSLYPSKI